jgi:hypothetical protein
MPANSTAGFATLAGSPRVVNITNLSTTPQQVLPVLDTGVLIPSQSVVRCRIYNLSTSNSVAFTVGDSSSITSLTTGSSPTASSAAITSAGTNALTSTDGVRIGAGQSVEINIVANQSIWLVANAGPTPVQVSFFAQNG